MPPSGPSGPPSGSSSRFSGLYLSGRALAVLVLIVVVVGGMAFYRTHTSPAEVWAGLTHSTEAPLEPAQVPTLTTISKEQEVLALRVAPAVVAVNVTAHDNGSDGTEQGDLPPDNPLSQFFGQFGRQFPRRPHYEQGLGSGIIISPDGFIVTNNHVVKDATAITVTLNDKRVFHDAKVVGTDPLTDLAVIKIDASGLPNLPWGNSQDMKQGDLVFAFGNPFQLNFTMTHGIISGKGRIPQGSRTNLRAPGDYIQTDAAINPGNSGGPLVNVRGEVIGVNSFIFTSTGSFSGEAFAIPSEIARPIAATLIKSGKVIRGYLGITIAAMSPELAPFFSVPSSTEGALVSTVTPDSPGAKAGIQVGDLIVSFDGKTVEDATQLQLDTGAVAPGQDVKLGVLRDGKHITLTAKLGFAPGEQNQTARGRTAPSASQGAHLGVGLEDLTPDNREKAQVPSYVKGALISRVVPGSPAYNAGLVPGMIITNINRIPMASSTEVTAELKKLPPNKDILLRVFIGGPQAGASFIVVHPSPATAAGGGGQ